jgi:hypothetical protein
VPSYFVWGIVKVVKNVFRFMCGISTLISAHSVRKNKLSQAQDRPVAAHMEIFEMELRDDAGSGGEETRMRRGLTDDKKDDKKLGSLR